MSEEWLQKLRMLEGGLFADGFPEIEEVPGKTVKGGNLGLTDFRKGKILIASMLPDFLKRYVLRHELQVEYTQGYTNNPREHAYREAQLLKAMGNEALVDPGAYMDYVGALQLHKLRMEYGDKEGREFSGLVNEYYPIMGKLEEYSLGKYAIGKLNRYVREAIKDTFDIDPGVGLEPAYQEVEA